jgi:hypothetical protein
MYVTIYLKPPAGSEHAVIGCTMDPSEASQLKRDWLSYLTGTGSVGGAYTHKDSDGERVLLLRFADVWAVY